MWPFNLSVRLPIVALVGRYPANWLIGRESIFQRIAPLINLSCDNLMLCGISVLFRTLSPSERQVTHALLTRPPLSYISASRRINQCSFVRLECVKHAASVHPEPGSNSLNIVFIHRSSLRCLNRIQSFFLSFFLLFVLCVQSSLLTRFLVFFVVVLFSKTVSPPLSETA